MPAYLVLVGLRPLRHGRTYTHRVEARDAEEAASLVVEMRGGDRSKLQAVDPVEGMPVYHCGPYAFAVERLTPQE
jgi:hypothetical protein